MFSNGLRDRRNFLKGSLTAAGLALTAAPSKAQAKPWLSVPHGLPTVQLYTDETSAQFRILTDRQTPVVYRVTASDGSKPIIASINSSICPFNDHDSVEHLTVTGLNLKATYELKSFDSRTGAERDARTFRALDTRKPNGRFALASCMLDLLIPIQAYMWEAMENAKVDVIFIIGDATYVDITNDSTLRNFWQRHVESRHAIDLYFFKNLVPVIATWDDHDFAGNNADKYNPLNGKTAEVFRAMFGWTPRGNAALGLGVSSYVEFFGQRFFLMDGRTYRDPYLAPKGLHWGEAQEKWLFGALARDHRPAWLLNGSQYYGAYLDKDSFEQRHPFQFQRVIKNLRDIEAPVLFGSGDVHFSEIMRIEQAQLGYETIEITSSSMHSTTAPWVNRKTNPRRVDTTWHFNFVVGQGNASQAGRFKFRTTSVGKNLKVYFDRGGTINRTSKDAIR